MKLRFFHIVLLILISQLVFSAEKTNKDTFSIDEVYVTRVRPAERDISAASLQSVGSKELEIINGSTAADAIKNFSGVSLKDYGGIGGFKTVMVRSLGANHTGVFVDGIQISDAATGQVDLGKISIENTESVSLFIGQPDHILQPARMYASASVLSLQTKNLTAISKPVTFNAGIKSGSFGLINPNLRIQNKWNSKLYSAFSLNYSKADGMYPFKIDMGNNMEQKEYRRNSEIESYQFHGDLFYTLSDSSNITCKINYYDASRGLPGAVVLYNPYSSQQLWNRDFFVNFKLEQRSNARWNYLSQAKFSQNYLRYNDRALNEKGIIDNRYTQQEYYASQAISYATSFNLSYSLASDFIINKLDANLSNFALPVRYSSLTTFSLSWNLKRFEMYSSLLGTVIWEETRNNASKAAKSRNIATPTLGASFLMFKKPSIRLRFLYKDIFRMPTFDDLYYTQIGNVNLNPERAQQYSIGVSAYTQFKNIDYISLKAELFQNKVKDKIIAIPTNNLFIWSMHNIGIVDIKGLETNFNLQTHFLKDLKYAISINYSYQQALDKSLPGSSTYNQQIPYIPFENLSGLQSISYKSASLGWNCMFNGYRYMLGENIYANYLPSWWLHDVNMGYKIQYKMVGIKIKAEINNLFDKQYDVVKSFPMPGRSYNLSLMFSY